MKNSKKKQRIFHVIAWAITVAVSLVLLFLGNKAVTKDIDLFKGEDTIAVARITELGELIDNSIEQITYLRLKSFMPRY